MQLRTDFSVLSFSAPVAWTGWSSVFKGKAMIQSRRQRSNDTTNCTNNKMSINANLLEKGFSTPPLPCEKGSHLAKDIGDDGLILVINLAESRIT